MTVGNDCCFPQPQDIRRLAVRAVKFDMNSLERHRARYLRRVAARQEKKAQKAALYDNFDVVFSFSHLWKSHKKCLKGVGWKASTQRYRNSPITNIYKTYTDLHRRKYHSKGFYSFYLVDRGKTRFIRSVHISERVVQRCLCDFSLAPMLVSTLIYDNAATIKGRGVHFARRRLVTHLKRFYRANGNSNNGFALVTDFKGYFDSINHDILKGIIKRYYKDGGLLWVYDMFIDAFGDVGLGLGSQVSQISAVKYPDDLDKTLKSWLQQKFYARYMDDTYNISESKAKLGDCFCVMRSLCDKLGLTLNYRKTQIVKLSRGICYLKERVILTTDGAVIRLTDKKKIKRLKRKIRVFERKIENGKMTVQAALESCRSSMAAFSGCNANKARGTVRIYLKNHILRRFQQNGSSGAVPLCKRKRRK